MKKMILGIAWQTLGFLGAITILCTAAHLPATYNGRGGTVAGLLVFDLMLPLIVCIVLFVAGIAFSFRGLQEK